MRTGGNLPVPAAEPMPGDPAPFQRLQRDFAAHIRDPGRHTPPPGIEPRRMKIYTDLFIRNIDGVLAGSFPVLHRILPEDHWQAMVRDFYARHQSRHPQFWRVAEEFLAYLGDERGEVAGDPPFLRELAHYEWAELALGMSTAAADPALADPNGDLVEGVPVLSPLAWPLVYAWPVHRLSADFQPAVPPVQPTCLVVYRDRADEVRFMEVNPVTARLLALVEARPGTGRALLERIAGELGHPEPALVVAEGAALLARLRQRDILLGTRR